ncbi:MAG: thiamine pyrophosphate-binding protein [Pseudomonadota bacterium]
MAKAADLLARALYQAGCRHAFGIPGGEVLTVMHALSHAGIDFHLAKHENPAGFMAEGTYHVTGAPGILVATLGPGVANAANVIANAYQDRVPLIFLTGCVDPIDQAGYTHQVFDHVRFLEPITKASFTLIDGAIETIAEKALSIALEGRPGPVHIDVPISLAAKDQGEGRPAAPRHYALGRPVENETLDQARQAFRAAERPILIAGLEVLHQGGEEAVARLAQAFNIPLITTYKAKGILPEDHGLCLGGAGLSPAADKHLLPLIQQADLVLLAGYDPIEMRHGWKHIWNPDDVTVLDFVAAPADHAMHRASWTFLGNIAEGLAAVSDQATPKATWPEQEPNRVRQALAQTFAADEDWGPAAIIDEVQKHLPGNAIATVDSGAHRILLAQIWRCPAPRSLLQSSGLCTMGCALPLAMGAKLADPSRPVVAFSGDAGLEMILGELTTLRDLAIPVVVVVFVDASLALIELKQRNSGRENLGVDFGQTDFAGLTQALGGHGITATSRQELATAMDQALSSDRFTVIAAQIPRTSYDGRF